MVRKGLGALMELSRGEGVVCKLRWRMSRWWGLVMVLVLEVVVLEEVVLTLWRICLRFDFDFTLMLRR